ncbi:hypothetical protein Btru_051433 [Bulinus truncatus]|nr:hypothetical protein Btru_051433 [Bulinus truncatus]
MDGLAVKGLIGLAVKGLIGLAVKGLIGLAVKGLIGLAVKGLIGLAVKGLIGLAVKGNVNYEDLGWFRAVCNPNGATPCCFNNMCVNKTVQECQCTECYDFRPKVYAELADWIPDDPTCRFLQYKSKEQVCDVLKNVTVYFIGDSFLRQIYISLLGFLEKSNSTNIFVDNTSPALIEKCDKHYRYIAECRHSIKHDIVDCDGSTRLHLEETYLADHVHSVLAAVRQLSGMNNSWFIIGFGAHDSYNVDHVQKKLLEPLLSEISKSDWPRLVWCEPQAAGLLKTPTVPQQLNPYRINFNVKVNELMTKHNVPVLRFYNMTSLALSYDGSHYGKGVNDVKAQIILNYILEQRSKR